MITPGVHHQSVFTVLRLQCRYRPVVHELFPLCISLSDDFSKLTSVILEKVRQVRERVFKPRTGNVIPVRILLHHVTLWSKCISLTDSELLSPSSHVYRTSVQSQMSETKKLLGGNRQVGFTEPKLIVGKYIRFGNSCLPVTTRMPSLGRE
jgi:hypothetical protein